MNIHTINGCIIVICSGILGLHPFFHPIGEKRLFARWSKAVFTMLAILGVSVGLVTLAQSLGWRFLEGDEWKVERFLSFGEGMSVGLLLALILSGQLLGSKSPKEGAPNEPNQSAQPTPPMGG